MSSGERVLVPKPRLFPAQSLRVGSVSVAMAFADYIFSPGEERGMCLTTTSVLRVTNLVTVAGSTPAGVGSESESHRPPGRGAPFRCVPHL